MKASIIPILLVTFLTVSFSYATPPPPGFDPHREWTAEEYADSVIFYTKKKYPELNLTLDLSDLKGMTFHDESDDLSLKQRFKEAVEIFSHPAMASHPVHFKLMESFKHLIDSDFKQILHLLESGNPIAYRKSTSTDDEYALIKWLQSQPDGSVYPHEFMAEALRITEGRVIAAWALAWNTTSRDWPGTPLRNYDFKILKFVSMTGEQNVWSGGVNYIVLPEGEWKTQKATVTAPGKPESTVQSVRRIGLAISKRGDEFSYLYHRIGVELLAMVVSKVSGQPMLGDLVGKVGAVGEWLKYMQTSGLASENEKRVSNDVVAALSGSRIFALVEKKTEVAIDESALEKSVPYFKSNPKKFDSKYILPVGRPPWYFRSKTPAKFWAPAMSVEELEYRFYHVTQYDSDSFNPTILLANGEYERMHRGLVDYLESDKTNEQLNSHIQNYLSGMRAVPAKSEFKNNDNDLSPFGINLVRAHEVYRDYNFHEAITRLKRLLTKVHVTKRKTAASSTKLPSPEPISCLKVLDSVVRPAK